jgi:hypothetical protein
MLLGGVLMSKARQDTTPLRCEVKVMMARGLVNVGQR